MTTSATKSFPLAAVLSLSTGILMSEMDGVYQVAEFLSGGPVWTHQLVRLGPLMEAEIRRQHPKLPGPEEGKAAGITPDNVLAVLADWETRFGKEISLIRPEIPLERRDPVGELVDMVGADRVAVIEPRGDDDA